MDTANVLRIPAAIPATSTIFYAGQAIMRDGNGNFIQCDDTQKGEFVGVLMDIVRTQVDPVDTIQVNGLLGDKMFDAVQPILFTCLITAAAAGDEGRKVYWQFNNQVSYSPGVNGNYAGTVWWVKDATHVVVLPPWSDRVTGSAQQSALPIATGSGTAPALTKWDVNRTFQVNPTAALTVILPPVAKVSPGDRITFIKMNTAANQVTLQGSGTDLINGAATSAALGTTQYSTITVETDGTQWYRVV